MSEEDLIKQEFGLGDEQQEQPVEQEQGQQVPELSAEEQRAWDDGWRPQDQFEGDPDRWKTAREFNMYGEFQKEIRDLKAESRQKDKDFEDRLAGVNKFHQAQMESKVKELKAQQREAVANADPDEFDRIQSQIDDVESRAKPEPSPQPGRDPAIVAWEEKNPWINDGGEKASDAIAIWDSYAQANPNGTVQQALAHVENKINRLYPDEQPTNPRRDMPSMNERPTQQAQRRNGRELTMNDLTMEERQSWQQFGREMFGSEKAYLKAVADARKQ